MNPNMRDYQPWSDREAQNRIIDLYAWESDHRRWERECFPPDLRSAATEIEAGSTATFWMQYWTNSAQVSKDCFDQKWFDELK